MKIIMKKPTKSNKILHLSENKEVQKSKKSLVVYKETDN